MITISVAQAKDIWGARHQDLEAALSIHKRYVHSVKTAEYMANNTEKSRPRSSLVLPELESKISAT